MAKNYQAVGLAPIRELPVFLKRIIEEVIHRLGSPRDIDHFIDEIGRTHLLIREWRTERIVLMLEPVRMLERRIKTYRNFLEHTPITVKILPEIALPLFGSHDLFHFLVVRFNLLAQSSQ